MSAPMKRLALASVTGTALEYYDFAVYNTLAALVFNQLFFPAVDPVTGTLLAFATYWVGYLSRPLGGVLFGHLGDRRGRRYVLVMTLLIMGVSTTAIGMLPTYEQAGVLAPLLLVALRFIQGMALGGEWAGAVLLSVEHGTDAQRGRNASFAQMGPSTGVLMATGAVALTTWLMSEDTLLDWGWRAAWPASGVAFDVAAARSTLDPAFLPWRNCGASTRALTKCFAGIAAAFCCRWFAFRARGLLIDQRFCISYVTTSGNFAHFRHIALAIGAW